MPPSKRTQLEDNYIFFNRREKNQSNLFVNEERDKRSGLV